MLSNTTIKVAIGALEGERVHGASHMNSFQADAHRAKIDAALAELKSIRPQEYEVVPDGKYDAQHRGEFIEIDRDYLTITVYDIVDDSNGIVSTVGIPEGWQLWRPRTQAQHRLAQ